MEELKMKSILTAVIITMFMATACYAQQVPMNINPAKADRLKLILPQCAGTHPTSTSCSTDRDLIDAFVEYVKGKVSDDLKRIDRGSDRTIGKDAEKVSRDKRTPDDYNVFQ